MELSKVEYSSRKVTLQHRIWMEQAAGGSFQAILNLILARTDIEEAEALQLDDEELSVIIGKIAEGMVAAVTLSAIGRLLGNV